MLFTNFLNLFLESAPWLLLGLILAGMLKMFVPMSWMHKQLGGHGFKSTVKAALLGAPLPLCSCGVLPAAIGLRRSGASKAATTSFLVSTPETGIDSVAVSYVLLGPFMTIVRPIVAIISAITAGLLVGRDEQQENISYPEAKLQSTQSEQPTGTTSCCSSKKTIPSTCSKNVTPKITKIYQPSIQSSGCNGKKESRFSYDKNTNKKVEEPSLSNSDADLEMKNTPIIKRILKGVQFATTDLVRDTAIWLLIGLFFAALVQTYIPTDFMIKWGDGILAMLVMVIISIPMYICATASTPIAAGLLLAGVSPGAVLVFMLAGPATNIATLGVVTKELGKGALWGYLGGVIGVALISGVVVNYLVDNFGFEVIPQIGDHHQLLPEVIVYSSGILLAVLMAKVLFNMLPIKREKNSCCS
jgi:uncharacterized membrane protein YraQ (UPF0718 family)